MKRQQRKRKGARTRVMRRVLLLIETSRAYGRGLVRGVAGYNREHGQWSIHFKPHGLADPPPPWLKDWQGDGILVRIGNQQMAAAVLQTGAPVVDLRGVMTDLGLPFVGVDDRAVAKLAAEHLLERGFKHFGFCGLPRGVHPHMDELCDRFEQFIEQAGYGCGVFKARRGPRRGEAWEEQQNRPAQWIDQQERVMQWIGSLAKPVGVMACYDDRAVQVLDACRRGRALVPDEVAVISVDNDQYLCELSIPPLTSIDDNPEQVGYEAAALLDRMMSGQAAPEQPTLIAPRGVVTRQSTDALAIEDRHVADAVRLIREQACEGVGAKEIVEQIPLSRVSLGPRFKRAVGRTILQEIQRVQIEQAKELLAATSLPIKQVAHRAGFNSVEYMTRLFGRITGETPGRYRKRTQRSRPEIGK